MNGLRGVALITHDQVKSEVQFLGWMIEAWETIQKGPRAYTDSFIPTQIDYLRKRIEALQKWDSEQWYPSPPVPETLAKDSPPWD